MRKVFILIVAGSAALVLLLTIFHFIPILRGFDRVVMAVARPIATSFYNISQGFASQFSAIKDWRSLRSERNSLQQENTQLKSKIAEFQSRSDEDQLLRKQLNFLENEKYPYIIARVISKTREEGHTFFLINRGGSDGVQEGSPVVSAEGALVGKIIKTNPRYAFIQPLTDTQSVVAGVISGKASAQGLIKGEHNLGIKMDMIPVDQSVETGELVVTSGIEGDIPPGILVGSVDRTTSNPGEIFQTAYVRPSVDFRELRLVTILTVAP